MDDVFKKMKIHKKPKGRARVLKVVFRVNEEEYQKILDDANRVGISKSEYLRKLTKKAAIKERPGTEFYEAMKQMIRIGNNLNQLTKKANSLNFIDIDEYKKQSQDWNKFMNEVKKKYL